MSMLSNIAQDIMITLFVVYSIFIKALYAIIKTTKENINEYLNMYQTGLLKQCQAKFIIGVEKLSINIASIIK